MTRILLVDDDPEVRGTTAWRLRLEGYEVVAVGDVDCAADWAGAADVAVLDPHGPGADSTVMAALLHSQPGAADVPVVCCSMPADRAHPMDTTVTPAAGLANAGQANAGQANAGQANAGQANAGQADAGQADAGRADAGQADAGRPAGVVAAVGLPAGAPISRLIEAIEELLAVRFFPPPDLGSFPSPTAGNAGKHDRLDRIVRAG